ncbi:hypothetical protein [Candidatus Methylomirabilis sp.]|uniref:Uncharacterized protein n=1 Tax=Candidatus Methylomirabilis tolerans TaxID=3123416 RepID=A0AAJ1AGZ9_9BACT|nr:hypothetical protein [Candidatus Methylomirabilis sp.]
MNNPAACRGVVHFKEEYYLNFVYPLNQLHANISSYSITPRWRLMLTQVERAIADLKYMEAGINPSAGPVKLSTPGGTYVHPHRIEALSALKPTNFDLHKLAALLNEISVCDRNRCYFALVALVRTVIDHVPPLFGCKTFPEVANSYAGGKSFKESMIHLDNSARKIADQHLHAQVRRSEVLPNLVSHCENHCTLIVIPAKAGIQENQ